jgi:hypothetical protein
MEIPFDQSAPARILFSSNGCGEQLYGRKNGQWLPPQQAQFAVQAGFQPFTYQAVHWFTFFFLPIVPLGVYRVLESQEATFGQRFHMTPVPWDWRQVLWHYAMAILGILSIPLIVAAIGLLAWALSAIAPPVSQ